jgi:hypothetical protein
MILKPAGFFRELSYGFLKGPSIYDTLATPLSDEEHILQYLRTGVAFTWAPGLENDILAPEKVIGSICILTDGIWAWPDSLRYYLENYHVILPQEFLSHVQSRNYIAPNPEEIDTNKLELLE